MNGCGERRRLERKCARAGRRPWQRPGRVPGGWEGCEFVPTVRGSEIGGLRAREDHEWLWRETETGEESLNLELGSVPCLKSSKGRTSMVIGRAAARVEG